MCILQLEDKENEKALVDGNRGRDGFNRGDYVFATLFKGREKHAFI